LPSHQVWANPAARLKPTSRAVKQRNPVQDIYNMTPDKAVRGLVAALSLIFRVKPSLRRQSWSPHRG